MSDTLKKMTIEELAEFIISLPYQDRSDLRERFRNRDFCVECFSLGCGGWCQGTPE